MNGQVGTPLRVVELSTGIAGAYCGWLLSEMGANVTRVVGPAPLNEADPDSTDPITLALAYYASRKDVMDAASVAEAIKDAEVVITDDAPLFASLLGRSIGEVAAQQPTTVFGVSSIFGLTGPLAGMAAVPLNAQAEAGVSWALGEPGRPPLAIPPGVLDCQTGANLAAAVLMARMAGPAEGGGRIVDIALNDILAHYVAVNCRFYIHHGMEWRREGRRAAHSGGAYPFVILPCADGAVCLSGRTRPEWERFVEAMGSPDWTQEKRYNRLRAMGQEYPEEVDALITPWLAKHTKAEIEEIADRYRLTIAPLRDLSEVLATPQFQHREFLRKWTHGDREFTSSGLPFRVSKARGDEQSPNEADQLLSRPAPTRKAAGDLPLAGLRVLDLGWVWSAPQVGSILAQLGAEVIKVEHGKRPDNSRMSGVIIRDGERIEGQTMDMSPMFHQINKGKLGITLNLKEPAGIAMVKQLAANSDVVLENMSAGSLERSDIGYDTLSADNPGLVMVAMSGAGQFGPASDMRTYAPTMSSFVGLESLVGYPGEAPTGALNFALGDPNAAVHALVALFGALERREAIGEGCYIDLSQTEALYSTLMPYTLQAQREGEQPPPVGNQHPTMAPHGIYPAAGGDGWLAIAVRDDCDWQALCALAPSQSWAQDPRFATAKGRIDAFTGLDRALDTWTRAQDRDTLVSELRAAGIPASPVNDIDGLWNASQIAARAMADVVDVPGLGAETFFRVPWNVSGIEVEMGTRGPMLGEHNDRVLRGLLGLSAEEFAELAEAGVIA
jgi:crotonobetainyl-CoA:carnitine CoA-transferase CaiB-like acyl-CoA transferase